jgi:hypothetical protein
MGLVTRAFLSIAGELPLVGRLFTSLNGLHNAVQKTDGPRSGRYRGISAHSLCCAAHVAFAPAGEAVGEQHHGTGFRAIADTRSSRCHMPDCRDSESLLGHCLPRAAFDAASRAGLMRSTRDIDAGPLTLLITRLDCWRHCLPYISVRDRDKHLKFLSCPYWVHDAIANLATVVPRLLLDPEIQLLARSHVATSASAWVDDMKAAHAREQWHRKVYRPIRGPVRSADDVVTATVENIWLLNRQPSFWNTPGSGLSQWT